MEGNNAAKLREALSDAYYAMFNFLKTQNGGYEEMATALDKAKAALAAPPRSCDMGTAEEQAKRFGAMCDKYYNDEDECNEGCPLLSLAIIHGFPRCQAYWAQMPYEGGAE